LQSNEPGDAMRVVNVLLTQLDRLQARPNVLVMTTSNMLDASDMAFIDRADLSIELDKPGIASTYEILRSCIEELILRGIVTCPSSPELPAYSAVPREVSDPSPFVSYAEAKGHDIGPSAILVAICQHLWSKELGGRALRRLALMAHAWFIQKEEACTLEEFLEALAQAALAKHE
jgi:SpoVK/Ycf46/Vps4 family AAA+-type ATPase